MTSQQKPKVLTTPQVAKLLGWSEEYVRKGMARNGIKEVRGWPENEVMALLPQIQDARERNPGHRRQSGPPDTPGGEPK